MLYPDTSANLCSHPVQQRTSSMQGEAVSVGFCLRDISCQWLCTGASQKVTSSGEHCYQVVLQLLCSVG
eukprot:377767-Amphidinium_carterae.1